MSYVDDLLLLPQHMERYVSKVSQPAPDFTEVESARARMEMFSKLPLMWIILLLPFFPLFGLLYILFYIGILQPVMRRARNSILHQRRQHIYEARRREAETAIDVFLQDLGRLYGMPLTISHWGEQCMRLSVQQQRSLAALSRSLGIGTREDLERTFRGLITLHPELHMWTFVFWYADSHPECTIFSEEGARS